MPFKAKVIILAILTIVVTTSVLLLPPFSQNKDYHQFADQRAFMGVSNFMNVVSNVPFVAVGILGLFYLQKYTTPRPLVPVYGVLFIGIALTGIGSAYYHLAPDNHRLVWDRLPMTLVFMAFLSAVVAERINMRAGSVMLWPLLVAGVTSVWWWYYTEQKGEGDLRVYGLVQFYPMLIIPLIMIWFKAQRPDSSLRLISLIIGLYIVAKACEHFDTQIFKITGAISGHSLKHLFADAATWFIIEIYKSSYNLKGSGTSFN